MLNLNFQNGQAPALNARNMNAVVESINALGYAVGGPNVASTVSAMTDTSKVYVYTGSETGYTAGNWYYYNGSAWVSGGVYQATAVETDTTLTMPGEPADAKATGDHLDTKLSCTYSLPDNSDFNDIPDGINRTDLTYTYLNAPSDEPTCSGCIVQVTFSNNIVLQHIYNTGKNSRTEWSRVKVGNRWYSWGRSGVTQNELSGKLDYGGILYSGDNLDNITDGIWNVSYGEYPTGPDGVLSGYLLQVSYSNNVKIQYLSNAGRPNKFEWNRVYVSNTWGAWGRSNLTSADLGTIDSGQVGVYQNGTNIYIRGTIDNDNDICIKCGFPYQGYNYTFNFVEARKIPKSTSLDGTAVAYNASDTLKDCLDDTPAITYGTASRAIGANHGCESYTKLVCSHTLTENNIGEIWTDNNGNQCTVVQVFSGYIIVGKPSGDWLQVVSPTSISRLGVTINISESSAIQLRRSAIRKTLTLEDETHKSITNKWANKIIVTENYWIADPVQVLEYLQENVGNCTNASYYSDSIPTSYCIGNLENIYTFTAGAKCNVVTTFKSNKDFNWARMHVALAKYFPTSCYGAVPNSSLSTLTSVESNTYNVTFDAQAPYDYFITDDQTNGNGWFVRYLPNSGIMKNGTRTQTYCARFRIDAKKLYPEMYSDYPVSVGDTLIMVSGYGYTPVSNGVAFSAIDMGAYTACTIFANVNTNGIVKLPFDLQNRRIVAKDDAILDDYTTTSVAVDISAGSAAHFSLA